MCTAVKTTWGQHQYATCRAFPPRWWQCTKQRRTIPWPLLACEDHSHSIQPLSCAPWCLACYYICPVYCGFCTDPPQLLSPARVYVRAETDLNTVSTVIVPPHTVQCPHCHGGPLSHISSPPLLKPRPDGRTDGHSQSSPELGRLHLSWVAFELD